MEPLFWLDVIASALSVVIAAALALIVAAAGFRRAINFLFASFALMGGIWAACHSIVAVILAADKLWALKIGDPVMWQQLSTLSFGMMAILFLMFTVRYLNRRARWADLAGVFGVALVAVSWLVPTLHEQLVAYVRLESGLPTFALGNWGSIAAGIVALYYVWCLVLFALEFRRTRELYLPISILILLVGLLLRTTRSDVPITSVTATFSIALMGYGVISRQLFNPLKELTSELERKVEDRTRELEEANQSMARRGIELEAANMRLQEVTQRMERRLAVREIGRITVVSFAAIDIELTQTE